MKKILFLLLIIISSCSGSSKPTEQEKQIAQKYIEIITGFTCDKAELTDGNYLVIAIDATGSDYDPLAQQFLEEAKNEGLVSIKGVYIVDSKDCQFGDGWVKGNRIGKAFNK